MHAALVACTDPRPLPRPPSPPATPAADEVQFVSAAADSYSQLALLHAEENAKSFEEVGRHTSLPACLPAWGMAGGMAAALPGREGPAGCWPGSHVHSSPSPPAFPCCDALKQPALRLPAWAHVGSSLRRPGDGASPSLRGILPEIPRASLRFPAPPRLQVEADKARRADRISRDPDYDEQQGVARDYVTREIVKVADST